MSKIDDFLIYQVDTFMKFLSIACLIFRNKVNSFIINLSQRVCR